MAAQPDMKVDEGVAWFEVFEGLAQPVAVCDEAGALLAANAAARRALAITSIEGVSLLLDARETVDALGSTSAGGREFFLPDVDVMGAPVGACSVMCSPLTSGGFRVTLVEAQRQQDASPGVRLMRALGRASEHAALFSEPDELTALFGAALADVFPEYAVHLRAQHQGAPEAARYERAPEGFGERRDRQAELGETFELGRTEMLWRGSRWGARFALTDARVGGVLYVERREPRALTAAERSACELFVHVFTFISSRQLASSPRRAEGVVALGPIMDSLHAAVVMCDERRAIQTCNAAFEAAVGEPAEDLIGRDVADFFDEDTRAALRANAASAMSGARSEPLEGRLERGGVELTVHITPLGEQDAPSGFLVVGQVAASSIAKLERELERAEQLMQLGQLATGVAHELKNPLTSILNYADYLLQKYRDQFFERRDSERLQRIIEGVERMDGFVKDLVTLARPQDGAPAVVVDVHDVLRQSLMLCEVALEQHRADVRAALEATDASVLASPGQLTQIFVNLIQNSTVALSQEGGFIDISTRTEREALLIELSDDGCGMTDEELARVFEPFYTTRRGTGGSGLGMVLVRSLVERHGGALDLESAAGEGTTVRLRFPLASVARAANDLPPETVG